jgi:DHA1 family inner membrane transport protein
MFAAFSVIPFISTALVANVGVTQDQLPIVFIAGGLLTLVMTPLAGRLVDRVGPLRVLCGVVPLSAVLMLAITHLPKVGILAAAPLTAALMATNSSRMVTATSLVMASIEPRRRGGFMSIKSSIQHLACGLGTTCAGVVVDGGAGEPLRHYGVVGVFAAGLTLASLLLASRVRPLAADGEHSLHASAERVRTSESPRRRIPRSIVSTKETKLEVRFRRDKEAR